jgi:hypothetical protein
MLPRYGTYVPEARPFRSAVTGKRVRAASPTRQTRSVKFAPSVTDRPNKYYQSSNKFGTIINEEFSSTPVVSNGRVRYQSTPGVYFTKQPTVDITIPYDDEDALRITRMINKIFKRLTNQRLSEDLVTAIYYGVLLKGAPRKDELFDENNLTKRVYEFLREHEGQPVDSEDFTIAIIGGQSKQIAKKKQRK